MDIIIHRGADQIGGCITEIRTEGCRILIDFGSNLQGCDREDFTQSEVDRITDGVDAIFYTHYHGDHTGMHYLVNPSIRQYIGSGAKEVMLCKYETLNRIKDFSKEIETTKRMLAFQAQERIDVRGRIFITPYFVSHSAFDSYLFKIECDGQTIVHTGDFRNHGYLGKGLSKVYNAFLRDIDILITEGTMLGRGSEHVISEGQIERNTEAALRTHKYVFALCSSTDLDRLASFHKACRRSHRVFLIDGFQSRMLNIFSSFAGKESDLFNFDRTFVFKRNSEHVIAKLSHEGFLMPVRMKSIERIKEIMRAYPDEEPWLIYSMWSGYAEKGKPYTNEDILEIREYFGDRILDGSRDGFHTSGHADKETLQEICAIANPRLGIIPIHKDKECDYEDLPIASHYRIFKQGNYEIENVKIIIK